MGGHSDFMIGLTSANEETGPSLKSICSCFGALPAAEDCQLALRGLLHFIYV